jgi:hypothetical protein
MIQIPGLALPISFLDKCYKEVSVANCEDNLATITDWYYDRNARVPDNLAKMFQNTGPTLNTICSF